MWLKNKKKKTNQKRSSNIKSLDSSISKDEVYDKFLLKTMIFVTKTTFVIDILKTYVHKPDVFLQVFTFHSPTSHRTRPPWA